MEHKLLWHSSGWEDYLHWVENDKKMLKKINALIKEIDRDPFKGTGKPEPLLHSLKAYWSRRIDREHRLVYSFNNGYIIILSCRYHY